MEKLKVSIEERDLVSNFAFGMEGIFPSLVTWNDLMPVVEKIRDLGHTVKIQANIGNSCDIVIYIGQENKPITVNEWNNRIELIECVWQAVIKFIQWYNSTLLTNKAKDND